MELVEKYWYVFLGALVLLYFVASRNSGGQIKQVGGGSGDTVALAQLSSAERDADLNRQYSFASQVLGYDLSLRTLSSQDALSRIGLSQQLDLARISADAQAQALANQFQLQQLQLNNQNAQFNAGLDLQTQSLNRAYGAQQRNDYLAAILSGVQTIIPHVFGNSVSGGQMNIPIFGGSNGGLIFH